MSPLILSLAALLLALFLLSLSTARSLRPALLLRARRGLSRGVERVLRSRQTLRLIAVTSLAAGAAWGAAVELGLASPVICAVAATLTVQVSIHSSFKEGASRIVATIAAMLLAYMTFHYLGIHVGSVVVVVGLSLIVGRLLRLGAEGSLQVPATSLFVFVMGSSLTDDLMWDRMAANLLGVALGVCFSLVAHPASPLERAASQIEALSRSISEMLQVLADGASRRYTQEESAQWLNASRRLSLQMEDAQRAVDDAVMQTRWSLSSADRDVSPLVTTARVLSYSCDQVNSIARSLFDAAVKEEVSSIPEEISHVLGRTGEAFALHADAVSSDPSGASEALEGALEDVRDIRRYSVGVLRSMDDTGAWLISGSILSDVDRMVEELDQSTPALEVEPLPKPPTLNLPSMKESMQIPSQRRNRRRQRH